VIVINEYRRLLAESESILKASKNFIDAIKERSKKAEKPSVFIRENTKEVTQKAEMSLKKNKEDRLRFVLDGLLEAKEADNELRTTERFSPSDMANRTYHLQRASLLQRGSMEDALKTYERLVTGLPKSEQKHAFIYGELLKERFLFEDALRLHEAEGVIYEHMSAEEKVSAEKMRMASALFEQNKIVSAQVDDQLHSLKNTGDYNSLPWDTVFDEMLENIKQQKPERFEELSQELAEALTESRTPYEERAPGSVAVNGSK